MGGLETFCANCGVGGISNVFSNTASARAPRRPVESAAPIPIGINGPGNADYINKEAPLIKPPCNTECLVRGLRISRNAAYAALIGQGIPHVR